VRLSRGEGDRWRAAASSRLSTQPQSCVESNVASEALGEFNRQVHCGHAGSVSYLDLPQGFEYGAAMRGKALALVASSLVIAFATFAIANESGQTNDEADGPTVSAESCPELLAASREADVGNLVVAGDECPTGKRLDDLRATLMQVAKDRERLAVLVAEQEQTESEGD